MDQKHKRMINGEQVSGKHVVSLVDNMSGFNLC